MSVKKFLSRYPDLLHGCWEMVTAGKTVDDMEYSKREELIYSVLKLMGRQVGGISFFYRDGTEDEVVDGWIDGLGKFTPHRIFESVEQILEGMYERKGDIVPRSVMDFKWFMKNRTQHLPYYCPINYDTPQVGFDQEGYTERKRETARENLKKIYLSLGKMYASVATTGGR